MLIMRVDLSQLLCHRLFNIVKLNEQFIDKSVGQFSLTRTQWKIIARFNFLPMPCTQQAMINSMGIDGAHLTRSLEKLENRALIKRERLNNDKRAYTIYLTKKGKSLLQKIEQILKDESCLLSTGLSKDENAVLNKALNKIEMNVKKALQNFNN